MTTTAPTTAKPSKKHDKRPSDEFVDYVLELCQTKKTRADLRTGLGLPVDRCNYLHRYLVPWTSPRMHPDAKRALYAVAALIAARPRSTREDRARDADDPAPAPDGYKRENLGASLAHAVRRDVIKPASAESELHLMARQSSEAIHPRLPALTRHLLTGGIDIDWAVLLEDLTWWNRDRDRVATRWLESYFRLVDAEDAEDDPDGGHDGSIDTSIPDGL